MKFMWITILRYLMIFAINMAIVGASSVFLVYVWASTDLPSITKIQDYRPPQVTTVYARDKTVIGYFFREKRFLVNLDNMPEFLPKAFLAAEDARFFEHQGVDFQAIVRAFRDNLRDGGDGSGGSTITQQLIKRLLLTPERTYKRKLKEAILAYQLEKYLTKQEILYLYLNQIYLGNSSYGVEAAARTYFGKHVNELTLAEAAVLAGLPQAPSRNNPYKNPANTRSRQQWVLTRMMEVGFISQAEYQVAAAEELSYKVMPDPSWTVGSWYLEEVRRQLLAFFTKDNVERLGIAIEVPEEDPVVKEGLEARPFEMQVVYDGGLHVYTAMDPLHQKSSEVALRSGLHEAGQRRGWLGPIEHIEEAHYGRFLTTNQFVPDMLANAGWAKALVTKVDKDGANVRLGEYLGYVSVKSMGWARTPNPRVSAAYAGVIRDATKVVTPGDVIWVSAIGSTGTANPISAPADPGNKRNPVPLYDPASVTPETVLSLSLEQLPDLQGAVASIEVDTGDLVAIAGGYYFSPESQFNRATQARRQPGSSFKPVVYSASLDRGFTVGTIVQDTPFVLPDPYTRRVWRPGNADGKFRGPMMLKTALALSRNVCTVRVAQQIGVHAVIERAHDLGIPGDIPAVLAISLGSYEATPQIMAEAYTAFANQGKRIKPRIISAVHNSWNEPLVTFNPDIQAAISPQNAYLMAYLLKGVVTNGTGNKARVLNRPLGGKTGTSNDERDAWFIGFTPHLVTSVYVGYDNNMPMGRSEYGGKAALPIFINYRKIVDPFYPKDDFATPTGITSARIDPSTGYETSGNGVSLPFMTGTVPKWVGGGSSEDPSIIKDLLF